MRYIEKPLPTETGVYEILAVRFVEDEKGTKFFGGKSFRAYLFPFDEYGQGFVWSSQTDLVMMVLNKMDQVILVGFWLMNPKNVG